MNPSPLSALWFSEKCEWGEVSLSKDYVPTYVHT